MIRSIFIGRASCCLRACLGLCLAVYLAVYLSVCRADDPIATVAVSASKLDQRRNDTAAMIVIGHDELMQQGDMTVADVLKRLPGLSIAGAPGQGGEIRMHGLGNGYTQVMLDGVPAPAGFSLDGLAPDLIERIEIMRVASAQLSNQAVAGAINIVLKKKVLGHQREFSAALARRGAQWSPGASAQLSGTDAAWSWTLAATLTQQRSPASSLEREVATDAQGQPSLLRFTPQRDDGRNDSVSVAPRLSWSPGGGDTVVSQNYASFGRIEKNHFASETDVLGGPSAFPDSASSYGASVRVLRSDLDWTHALDGGASLEIKLGGNDSRRRADFRFIGAGEGADLGEPLGEHRVASGSTDSMLQFTGSWRQPFGAHHVLALGWDASDKRRDEVRIEHDFSAAGALSAASDDSYAATIGSLALYGQDEWAIDARWSLYLGLRHESLLTRSTTAALAVPAAVSRTSVWSPLLQMLYKFAGKDQLRLALSHTYKAPAIAQLIPRRYVIDNNNSATNPDTEGNPGLRPELAWGIDAAVEHYLGAGLFSASVYLRRLRDVTIDRLSQSGGVWLSMPVNGGNASMRGIELEAKLPLQAVDRQLPPLELHANLTRNWSAIASIPGPDNRIDGQTALSANAGLDYRPPDARLSAGGNLSFLGAGPVRLSPLWSSDASPKRQLDLYALWKIDGNSRLRLSVLNLLRQDYVTAQRYADAAGAELRTITTPSLATLRLLWERKF